MNITVKIARTFPEKKTVAVDWTDDENILRRSVVPENLLIEDRVNEEILYAAPHYGIDWVFVLDNALKFSAVKVAEELRRSDIWNLEDIRNDPNGVIAALQRAYGLDYQILVAIAEAQESNKH